MKVKFRNQKYIELLKIVSALSRLFSEGKSPYLNYRIAENIFCRAFEANNLARKDSSFDASIGNIGIGLKTFLIQNDSSLEKVAEFNSISSSLRGLTGKMLAIAVSKARNERIKTALRLYDIDQTIYHCVGRTEGALKIFENNYSKIDLDKITLSKSNFDNIIRFEDQQFEYSYNISKSTLYKRFNVNDSLTIPIDILKDPFDLLIGLKKELFSELEYDEIEHIVLPLYSTQSKTRDLAEKSGLNQWNAGGRNRDFGEVYIPIPSKIRSKYPLFFPSRDIPFKLQIPTGEIFEAKVCQENSKALMTNPNNALSNWLLRKVLNLGEGELATRNHLDYLGIDSVKITKNKNVYSIDILPTWSYEKFINNQT